MVQMPLPQLTLVFPSPNFYMLLILIHMMIFHLFSEFYFGLGISVSILYFLGFQINNFIQYHLFVVFTGRYTFFTCVFS